MPTIPVSDVLGIDADGKLSPDAKLESFLPAVKDLKNVRLDQIPLDTVSLGLSFESPVDVDAGELKLKVGAGVNGSLAIIGPKKRTIDADDPFDSIDVGPNDMWVAVRLAFSVRGGANAGHFGLSGERELTITCYRRFEKAGDGFPLFGKALGTAVASFVLPRGPADLEQLHADSVVTLSGTGKLTLSGSFSAALPVQSLASVSLGVAKVDVNTGASISASAGVTLSGEYRVRVRKTGARTVEFGVYRSRSRELNVSVSARAGVSAKVSGFDLTEQLIGALSRQPLVDNEEFRKALPGEDNDAKQRRIEGFENSLKAAIDTRLQASVSAAFSSLRSDEAALMYEIEPAVAGAALASALGGDWSPLAAQPAPAGVVQKQNILTRTDVRKQTLKINLLGIVNVLSVAKLTQISRVERNAAGEITLLADSANASKLHAVLVNLGIESKRLRSLMNENFLIEAVYHASATGVLPPEFTSRHTYFEVDSKTSDREMKDNLDVVRALDAAAVGEIERRLAGRKAFGRTTFYVEVKYAGDAVRRMFLTDSGTPKSVVDYEALGRDALANLLAGDAGQEFRQRVASDDALWANMKRIGNRAGFPPLFGLSASAVDPRVEAAGGDYSAITSWAKAMHGAAEAVAETEQLLRGAGVMATDTRLDEARQLVKKRMAGVAGSSDEHFGDPLGMVMVYLAAGRRASVRVLLEGADFERLEVSGDGTLSNTAG